MTEAYKSNKRVVGRRKLWTRACHLDLWPL